jgi:hypothetical protein
MEMTLLKSEQHGEASTFCPCCGSSNFDDNRLSERLYAEAAKEAPRLRFEGKNEEAVDVLTALWAIRIANFVRHEWRCSDCGVTFDG